MIEFADENEKTKKKTDGGTPVLDNFSRDLNKLAGEGKLDPVIGRQLEIYRIAQILSRRKKNNPIIIGEPGAGKTRRAIRWRWPSFRGVLIRSNTVPRRCR